MIKNGSTITIVDPWFFGKIFNNSWELLKNTDDSIIDYSELKYISISHEHPDHLHWPTLKYIKSKVNHDIWILYPRRTNPNVMNECLKLGFKFRYLDYYKSNLIEKNYSITPFPAGHDSALVYEISGEIICNQNDAYLDIQVLKKMNRKFPRIDIWLFQFSLAGYYGNYNNPVEIYENGTRHHLKKFLFYQNFLKPKVSVPFASFVFFCKIYNNYLNEYRVKLSSLFPLSNFLIHIPFYGMDITHSNSDSNNLIEKYELLYLESKCKILPLVLFPGESEIIELLLKLVENGYFLKNETVIQFFDYENLLIIDSLNSKFEFLPFNHINKNNIAGILPSEEFLNYLKFPWGGDTLNITGCFMVKNESLWNNFLQAREVMYKR
jgi:hypothetical protein